MWHSFFILVNRYLLAELSSVESEQFYDFVFCGRKSIGILATSLGEERLAATAAFYQRGGLTNDFFLRGSPLLRGRQKS